MSDSVRPHRWQPTRLPCPWDSPGKNTGVGCHFLLQCMKVKSESEVAQSCPTLSDPMDCSLPGSSVHGIFQARVLEWGAIVLSIPNYTRHLQRYGQEEQEWWWLTLSCHCCNVFLTHEREGYPIAFDYLQFLISWGLHTWSLSAWARDWLLEMGG